MNKIEAENGSPWAGSNLLPPPLTCKPVLKTPFGNPVASCGPVITPAVAKVIGADPIPVDAQLLDLNGVNWDTAINPLPVPLFLPRRMHWVVDIAADRNWTLPTPANMIAGLVPYLGAEGLTAGQMWYFTVTCIGAGGVTFVDPGAGVITTGDLVVAAGTGAQCAIKLRNTGPGSEEYTFFRLV